MDKQISLVKWSKTIAKIGLLFANCDSEYAESEKLFIENFVAELESNCIISPNDGSSLQDLYNNKYTLKEVVNEVNDMLHNFNDVEKKKVLSTLNEFIENVIKADNKIMDSEIELYKKWKAYYEYDIVNTKY